MLDEILKSNRNRQVWIDEMNLMDLKINFLRSRITWINLYLLKFKLTMLTFKGPLQPKIFISEHDVIRPPENESVIIFFISLTVL